MLPLQIRIATAAAIAIACVGCTDKDREMARRTSDGSETFKYRPPSTQPAKPAPSGAPTLAPTDSTHLASGISDSSAKSTAPRSAAGKPRTPAGSAVMASQKESDAFHYRPDPRLLKQLSHPEGK